MVRKLGVKWVTEACVSEWHGDGATLIDHNTCERPWLAADSLVMATTNFPVDGLMAPLAALGMAVDSIGDCAAPRQAPYAFFDGRKIGLEI